MAQENSPDKEKRQGRTKKPEKPYVEQIDELLLVHNKNDPKEGLGVVSKADEKGNYQTVTPEEKNENSFLKFDKNSSILENFIKNFCVQGPNGTLQKAFEDGLIADHDGWRRMAKARVTTSHTYNEGDAIEIVRNIYDEYSHLLQRLDDKLNEEKLRLEMNTLF